MLFQRKTRKNNMSILAVHVVYDTQTPANGKIASEPKGELC